MSVSKKRKPFGSNAANTVGAKKHRVAQKSRRPKEGAAPSRSLANLTKNDLNQRKSHRGGGGSKAAAAKHKSTAAAPRGRGPDRDATERRRDSRTPKTSNLTAAAGAYDLRKEFDLCLPRGGKKKKHPSKQGSKGGPTAARGRPAAPAGARPDPSPVKLPDPSALRAPTSKAKRSGESAGHGGAPNRGDNFVSASLKRLFSSKGSTNDAEPARDGRTDGLVEHETSDMDTACSTPEKDSPLITSPLDRPDPVGEVGGAKRGKREASPKTRGHDVKATNDAPLASKGNTCPSPEKDSPLIRSPMAKLDPVAKVAAAPRRDAKKTHAPNARSANAEKDMDPPASPQRKVREGISGQGKLARKQSIGKSSSARLHTASNDGDGKVEQGRERTADPDAGKPTGSKVAKGQGTSDVLPRKTAADVEGQPKVVSKEALDLARKAQPQNKRVIEAMFHSGSCKSKQDSGASAKTLVGSMIGGQSLRKSDSVDESKVTALDYDDDSLAEASMTTRADQVETAVGRIAPYQNHQSAPHGRQTGPESGGIFCDTSEGRGNNTSSRQSLRPANAIEPTAIPHGYEQPNSTHLPAGWKVKWSRTKNKPYYVHPDFGSTWHCPGLSLHGPPAPQQLYNEQRIRLQRSKCTSHSSQIPRSVNTDDFGGSTKSNVDLDESRVMADSIDGMQKDKSDQGIEEDTNRFIHEERGDGGGSHNYGSMNGDANDNMSCSSRGGRSNHNKSVNSESNVDRNEGVLCLTQDFESNGEEAKRDEGDKDGARKEGLDPGQDPDDGNIDCGDGQGVGFDELVGDVDEERSNDEIDLEGQPDSDSIEFGNDQGGGFDECDDKSQGEFEDDEVGQADGEAHLDHHSNDIDGASMSSQVKYNSLASDPTDVNSQGHLSTIKESLDESDGTESRASSGVASNDEGRSDSRIVPSSPGRGDRYSIDRDANEPNNDEKSHQSYDSGQNPFQKEPQVTDNFGQYSDSESETLEQRSSGKGDKLSVLKKESKVNRSQSKRKTFSPGPIWPSNRLKPTMPLCSLQLLDKIQRDESISVSQRKRRWSALHF
ncbi:hypothetical protein ACHAWF_015873 [Thalassiosira exigua]